MNENDNYSLKVLPLFRRLVQPLYGQDIEALRMELMNNPGSRKIYTWRGNHLGDQQKYDICVELQLPIQISEMFFEDWIEAAIFLCNNQLKRNDLTDEYRKYLIGILLRYSLTKSGDPSKTETKTRASIDIGRQQYISAGTVQKYNQYSDAINCIFDSSEELANRILLGITRVSHENIVELSRLSKEEIKSISNNVIEKNVDHITIGYIRNEVKWSHIQDRDILSRKERREKRENLNAGIRKMPQYNPDSEVNSLCMTIDSWISSMERVKRSDNFSKITGKASLQLMNKLTSLEHTIGGIQESLMERTNI